MFKPSNHKVDFEIYVYETFDTVEHGINCYLGAAGYIDTVAAFWVNPEKIDGMWECSSCDMTARFNELESLIVEHFQCTLEGIEYLYSSSHVRVFFDSPYALDETGSTVWLDANEAKLSKDSNKYFLIRIGEITFRPYDGSDPIVQKANEVIARKIRSLRDSIKHPSL